MINIGGPIKDLVLHDITSFWLHDTKLTVSTRWSEFSYDLMCFALKHRLVSETELREVIGVRIGKIGRLHCFEKLSRMCRPDHTISPQALAYAIKYGELTPKEIARIDFDHGDDQYSFVSQMRPELLVDAVWEQLQAGPFDSQRTAVAKREFA